MFVKFVLILLKNQQRNVSYLIEINQFSPNQVKRMFFAFSKKSKSLKKGKSEFCPFYFFSQGTKILTEDKHVFFVESHVFSDLYLIPSMSGTFQYTLQLLSSTLFIDFLTFSNRKFLRQLANRPLGQLAIRPLGQLEGFGFSTECSLSLLNF